MNSEEFRETFLRNDREGPTKAEMAEKAAETHAGREERPETGSEEETSKDYSTGSEGTVGDIQATEEERIALAIDGKGEFLSEELKKLLMEIEEVQGLEAGTLGEEIEARLRGVQGDLPEERQRRAHQGRDGGEGSGNQRWKRRKT